VQYAVPEDRTRFGHMIKLAEQALLAVAQAYEEYGTK
jgi:hypothetical protein